MPISDKSGRVSNVPSAQFPSVTTPERVTYLRALCKTVPPTIVDWVLTNATDLALSQQCEGTLLNADLVGFTSICEEVATAGPDPHAHPRVCGAAAPRAPLVGAEPLVHPPIGSRAFPLRRPRDAVRRRLHHRAFSRR